MIVTALRPVNGYEDFVNPARSALVMGESSKSTMTPKSVTRNLLQWLEHGLPLMDLKAASDQNAGRQADVGWHGSLLPSDGRVLLATLAVAHPIERQTDVPLAGSSLSKVMPLFASFPCT